MRYNLGRMSSNIVLRDYQELAVENIRSELRAGKNSVCFVLPTGGGKTIITAYMIDRAINEKKLRCWFLVHRKELIDQTADKFNYFNFKYSYIASGMKYDPEAPAVLCMIQTLQNRIDNVPVDQLPDLIICDETHRVKAKTYLEILQKIRDKKQFTLIGVTATPKRLDGKGLKDVFQTIVHGPRPRDLIRSGQLSKYKIVAPQFDINFDDIKLTCGDFDPKAAAKRIEDAKIFGDVVSEYQKYLNGKQIIVFALNVEHSKTIAGLFNEAGISAAHLDGDTPKNERKKIIEQYRNGEILVLVNCNLFSEGFDVPQCAGISMVRPTASESMYLQMVGRALRPDPGKQHAIIIDHVRNWERHGFPCDERPWLLDYPKRKKQNVYTLKRCPICYMVLNSNARVCECGHKFDVKIETEIKPNFDLEFIVIDPVEGKKIFKTKAEKNLYIKQEMDKCITLADFKNLAVRSGYKPYWGTIQYELRHDRSRFTARNNKKFKPWGR